MTVENFAFASDNCSGVAPDAWAALEEANAGYSPGYGADDWTQQATDQIRDLFEYPCDVYFTFNGTAANSLALASLCRSYHSVIAHEAAHIETDECGAPEFFTHGTKLLLGTGESGRLSPEEIERIVRRRSDIHYPKPRAVSLTQPTELGTLYEPSHLEAIREVCLRHELRLHMDGARFANAIAALEIAPKEITWKAGVDVLCFGGTKNGMAVGDCVVFFDAELSKEFSWRCKQAGQLASKMRFLSAPWARVLRDDGWLQGPRNANEMAQKLADGLSASSHARLVQPVQANAVFVELSDEAHRGLTAAGWRYYKFIGGASRFMCSWQTTSEDVRCLLADLARIGGDSAVDSDN